MNQVIGESPAKAKTIKKYLGKDFEVVASMGHIRDLPKSKFGVDVENNFEPHYRPPTAGCATTRTSRLRRTPRARS